MADEKLTALTATTAPILTDITYLVADPGAAKLSRKVTLSDLQAILGIKDVADGRLTLESGVPVSTSDQANKTTLYYTFYTGNKIGLYDGTSWHVRTFAELSVDVSGYTASKPYDIWVYDNAGTPALDSTVWTDGTTRATALAYQDGVLVKSGATTRRYIGTIYIDSGQKCQDTVVARYVWNFYNRVPRQCYKTDSTGHVYGTAAYQQWNNTATNKVEFIVGQGVIFTGTIEGNITYSAGGTKILAGKLDAVNGMDFGFGIQAGYLYNNASAPLAAAVGYHYLAAVEYANGNATFDQYFLRALLQM